MLNKTTTGETPLLVASRVMALVESHSTVQQMAHGVEAEHALAKLPDVGRRRVRNRQLWIHILEVPLEWFTLQIPLQFKTIAYAEIKYKIYHVV